MCKAALQRSSVLHTLSHTHVTMVTALIKNLQVEEMGNSKVTGCVNSPFKWQIELQHTALQCLFPVLAFVHLMNASVLISTC